MPEHLKIIYSYSLKLLSGKEVPQKIIEEKIQKKYPETDYEEQIEIINLLKKEKFIDDERFCENFIYWRKENMPRGKNMIIQELIRKKINIDLAQKKCEDLISYKDEYKMCKYLAEIKFSRLKNINEENETKTYYKKKEKLFRFLASKMFSFGIINDVWEEIDI